jgi:sulfotransferase family protein
VVGCPRSGTTLLQLMLHAHHRIALPPETRFVLPAYERRLSFGDLREPDNRAGLARWITGREETRFHELGVAPGCAARPGRAELLRYRRVSALRRAARAKRRTLDRLTRLREPGPVAAVPGLSGVAA